MKDYTKRKYDTLLWDIDGTVLNFLEAEKNAIRALFKKYGFPYCTDLMLSHYSGINRKYWEALERGEMSKKEILTARFKEFFSIYGLDTEAAESFNKDYQTALGDTIVFNDGAFDIIKGFKGTFVQCAVTNGTITAQKKKLLVSGLNDLFDHVFISEELGYEKPSPMFMKCVKEAVPGLTEERTLIIGDSLTSDIKLGNNTGIDTCWYNPAGKSNDKGCSVTYEIRNLNELKDILPSTVGNGPATRS